MAKKKRSLDKELELPQEVTAQVDQGVLHLKGPKGEVSKSLHRQGLRISLKENKLHVSPLRHTQREKKMIGTLAAHVKNMTLGVQQQHVYTLKICSGHFPMTVSVSGNVFTVKNFLGEKIPRVLKIRQGAKVSVDGDKVTVESVDKEIAGQVSADIEQLTRRVNFDTRIFQDGIYLVSKSGKQLK